MTYRGEDILTIGVSIPASYPDEPSLIILANGAEAFPAGDVTSIHAQELEMEVNCFWRELPREDGQTAASDEEGDSEKGRTFEEVFAKGVGIQPENLLTCQLARIASCLPIFLDSGDNTDGQIKKFCPQGLRLVSLPLSLLPIFFTKLATIFLFEIFPVKTALTYRNSSFELSSAKIWCYCTARISS
uniref:RWD domain-containing protein n=1 Tax=Mesocestoides corti TaxID=53468 RepID=A0A5K3FUR1_MESCO